MKRLSKKQSLLLRVLLLIVMMIAPFANVYGYFSIGLYIVSALCLLGLFIVDFFTDKKGNLKQSN
jgi:hypothetical protein